VISIRDHAEATLARLRADDVLSDSTFEGLVEPDVSGERPQRYLSVFSNNGEHAAERATGRSETVTFTYTLHSVGSTPSQAQAVAERAFAQLLDFRPSIDGRRCGRYRHTYSQQIQIDDTVKPSLWYGVDEFELTTDPA
jgi:hypothetical protein